MPNDDPNVVGNVFAVHKFTSSFYPEPEIIDFVQMGAENGTITMKIIRRKNLTITYEQSRTIPFNCEIGPFLSALRAFSGYFEYPFDGERFVYDEYGALLNGSNGY